jgi:anti-anti-sigma factor
MCSGKVLYAKDGDTYILKFIGHIRYTPGASYAISRSLEQFISTIFERADFLNIIIDMTDAESIDSTNLGLLAKLSIYMQDKFGRKPSIVSHRENINRILHTICFDEEFTIVPDADVQTEGFDELPCLRRAELEEAKMVLDAHRTLIGLSESNERLFRSVVSVLEEDVARKQAELEGD